MTAFQDGNDPVPAPDQPLVAAVPSPARVPDVVDDRSVWAEETGALLDALPATQARVLRLAYGAKLSYAEIADRLGMTAREAAGAAAAGLRHVGRAVTVT